MGKPGQVFALPSASSLSVDRRLKAAASSVHGEHPCWEWEEKGARVPLVGMAGDMAAAWGCRTQIKERMEGARHIVVWST